jgi:hypothetical protein
MAGQLLRAALAASAAAFGVLCVCTPAAACTAPGGGDCASSTVAVNLAGGSLTLSVPASVTISGTLGASSSFSKVMGQVQVQDARGVLAGWSLTALTSGDLVTATTPTQTISLGTSNVGGPLTLSTGIITPGGLSSLLNVTAGTGGSLNPSQPVPVATALLGFGGGTYTMTPTLTLTPPANTVAASYSTTLTFTVAG